MIISGYNMNYVITYGVIAPWIERTVRCYCPAQKFCWIALAPPRLTVLDRPGGCRCEFLLPLRCRQRPAGRDETRRILEK